MSEVDQHTVTIAHERLIEAWPWLRKLVNENREAIALQNQIAEDAQEWEEHQRDASYLYSGARMANAREQLAAREIVLSGLAQAFVESSIDAVEEAGDVKTPAIKKNLTMLINSLKQKPRVPRKPGRVCLKWRLNGIGQNVKRV